MNTIVWIMMLLSLFISTVISLLVSKKGHKWIAILLAFIMNTVILSFAAFWLYQIDAPTYHKQTDGVLSSLGILIFIFFIPIITFINYCIVTFKVRG